jgi:hypothetical protein
MDRRWKLVLAFIAGTVFAEIAADPSDYIFFQLREKLTAEQSVMAWYFLTAAFYAALFAAAYMLASTRLISPENFVYAMMALVAVRRIPQLSKRLRLRACRHHTSYHF